MRIKLQNMGNAEKFTAFLPISWQMRYCTWALIFQMKSVRTASRTTWICSCVNYFSENGTQWRCSARVPLEWSRAAQAGDAAVLLLKTALPSSGTSFLLWGAVRQGRLLPPLIELRTKGYRDTVQGRWHCGGSAECALFLGYLGIEFSFQWRE